MASRIIAFAAALSLTPCAAFAQVYCSPPSGYATHTCWGDACEMFTDNTYDGYIGPSIDVSVSGTNCEPITNWPYYTLTDPPGDPPATGFQLTSFSAGAAPAPEIDPAGAIDGVTLLLGALAVLLGRRRQGTTVRRPA